MLFGESSILDPTKAIVNVRRPGGLVPGEVGEGGGEIRRYIGLFFCEPVPLPVSGRGRKWQGRLRSLV